MDATLKVSCLPGTRQDLLKGIIHWLMTPSDGQNTLWLHGAAGLGKSALANSVAQYFSGLRRRGAFLFFERSTPIESSPTRVIRTLAYQLAEHNSAVRSAIALVIDANPELPSAPLEVQMTSLITEPLTSASHQLTGPIIIVFDALDECGDPKSRRRLLSLLSTELGKLPRHFRFLITSRPDIDIANAFNAARHIHKINVSLSASEADVLLYIQHEMAHICSGRQMSDELPPNWPGVNAIQRLAAFAAGLFIWAVTAMKYLHSRRPGDLVVQIAREGRPSFLPRGSLQNSSSIRQSLGVRRTTDIFQQVLRIVVISQVPLTDTTMSELLGCTDSGRQCRNTLRRLGCLIQWSEGQPAQVIHKSFPDYLTDRARCSSDL